MQKWIFLKNISLNFAYIAPKLFSRAIINDDILLFCTPTVKKFTTDDFVILVKNRPSLDEIDEGLPRHPGGVKVTLKHFPQVKYIIISHVGPLWGLLGTHGGPKMAHLA